MKIYLNIALLCISVSIYAQHVQLNNNESLEFHTKSNYIRCISTEYENDLQKLNPKRASTASFESWMADEINSEQKKYSVENTNVIFTLPVVIHVIHNGDAIGASENISTAKALSQITVLNQDFRRMLGTNGFNSDAVGADIEIEFCMAQRTPGGAATNGINRVDRNIAQWEMKSDVENMKIETQWDPTQYFNIWVVYFTDSNSFPTNTGGLSNVLGYAQFPETTLAGISSNPNAETDGIVLDFRCFGSSEIANGSYFSAYNLGRTATHEVGHSLGLRHIWGDNTSCTVNATDSFKDFCPDTPATTKGNENCLQIYNSCINAAGNDMTENYMDYTNDSCLNLFTNNQKTRMRTVMQNSPRRSSLRTSTVCQSLSNPNFDQLNDVQLYPNPVQNVLYITNSNSFDSYEIFNSMGQQVASAKSVTDNSLQIDVSKYSAGLYFIKIYKDTQSKTQKFIKY